MPVKYNITERRNLQDPKGPTKFYASTKADGEIDLKALSKEIAGGSTTVSDTDVLAVLNDLVKALGRHLGRRQNREAGRFWKLPGGDLQRWCGNRRQGNGSTDP